MLDLVPGHTSWEHAWFKESLKPEKNLYSGRYVWTDDAWKDFDGIGNIRGFLRGMSDRDGSGGKFLFSSALSELWVL